MIERSNRPSVASSPTRAGEAALVASRALIGIAVRSLDQLDDLTIPQFRSLVVLASRGPTSSSELAAALGVHPSTVTRLVDRLAAKGFVQRSTPADRREVVVSVTPEAKAVIDKVSEARRQELVGVMKRLKPDEREAVVAAFEAFSNAAGELPENEWSIAP